jgi:hypothetical protein
MMDLEGIVSGGRMYFFFRNAPDVEEAAPGTFAYRSRAIRLRDPRSKMARSGNLLDALVPGMFLNRDHKTSKSRRRTQTFIHRVT